MLMHDELHLAPIGKNPQVGYALHPDVNLLLNVRYLEHSRCRDRDWDMGTV